MNCLFCNDEYPEPYYRFCFGRYCQAQHYWLFELGIRLGYNNPVNDNGLYPNLTLTEGLRIMADKSPYDIDKDVYNAWLGDKIIEIEALTKDAIEARIMEIAKIEFLAKREWAMLHQQYDKLVGRKSIPPWLKAERDSLIKEPNFKVDSNAEPRPKNKESKKEKEARDIKNLLGIDMRDILASAKSKDKENKSEAKAKPGILDNLIGDLVNKNPRVEPKVELTPEEKKAKADAFRAKMLAGKK